jgi:hypothetical protein
MQQVERKRAPKPLDVSEKIVREEGPQASSAGSAAVVHGAYALRSTAPGSIEPHSFDRDQLQVYAQHDATLYP